MFQIPTADDLVTFVKDFTGSTNDNEIKRCIFMAEMSMRNIELPALRCDPYAPENIGVANRHGRIPIPGDMNKPILFFKQGQQYLTTAQGTGNVGENTITLSTTPNQSLTVGMLVYGTGIASGATITSFPGPGTNLIQLSANNTGAVNGTITFQTPGAGNPSQQTGPWIVYDRIGDRDVITQGMIAQLYLQPVNVPAVIRGKFSEVGQEYEFLPYVAEGDLINMYYYKAWPLLFSPTDEVGVTVQTNAVLATFPEGYVYGTLREYYIKRHNDQDAGVYQAKFQDAWNTVEDQNNLGKWSGGHTRLTSVWQPRQYRQYNIK
jgi:hypothetical protein